MTYSMISKAGGRSINEDFVLCINQTYGSCFAVADGLGGHGKGEVASRMLAEVFNREFCSLAQAKNEKPTDFLKRAFNASQAEIMSAQQKTANRMKTTGVALAMIDGMFAWGHIGDSRLYYFHKGKFKERTIDHSVSQMLALSKEIQEADIATHPDRNKLLRVMGDKWDEPRYELSAERKISKGGAFLLCSDGFWELMTTFKIESCLKRSRNAGEWLSAMTAVVEDSISTDSDNYSAITVMI